MSEITARWTGYGREAAAVLAEEIGRAKAGEPLAPVTVVVASNQVGLSVRRLLASGALAPPASSGRGLIGVTFVTPYRLAELLGATVLAGRGLRPVSRPVLAAATRAVLAEDPGVYAPVAEHPATEAALVSTYRELRDLTPALLDAVGRRSGRAAEVVRVHRAVRQRLAGSWSDEEDLMAAATAVVRSGAPSADLGAVIAYLPERLGLHTVDLLRAIGEAKGLVVVAGRTGDKRADAEVEASIAALGVGPGVPARAEGFSAAPLPPTVSTETTRLVTTSDADDEVREAVRLVVDAARSGTSLDRIAILHASPEPYGRLTHDHLAAAGIALNGAAESPVSERLAGRVILGMLALPATGFGRSEVFAWLSDTPLVRNGRPVSVSAWERTSRSAGITAGAEQWDRLLDRWAAERDSRADAADAEPSKDDWVGAKHRREAERARELRGFVLGVIADLERAASAPRPWSTHAEWASDRLADLIGSPGKRASWPLVERRAAERVELALARLGALDEVEGPVDLDVFTRTLAVELEADLGRTGRFGEGVLVGPVSLGVGVDLDLLVLLGMAEGTFPAPVAEDSLLPDDDRESAAGALRLRSGHVDRLHHQFLATLAGAETQVLLVPRGDLRRSRDRVPSRWALDVASELAGRRWWSEDLASGTEPWLSRIGSFDHGLRRANQPATAQEHRLRSLLHLQPTPATIADVSAKLGDRALSAAVALVTARSSKELTRFDGNLTGLAVPSPIERGTSATRLQGWSKCPHAYFMQSVLGVEPVEAPEEALEMEARHKGTLIHAVLERLVQEAIDTGSVPEPHEPWSADHHRRLDAIAEEEFGAFESQGLTGRRIFWDRDRRRLLPDLHRTLDHDDRRRRSDGSRPIHAELAFGIDDAPGVGIVLTDGRRLGIRGKVDRVDRRGDGSLGVIDYKTGSAKAFSGLSAADPHQGGSHLQLAMYAAAAKAVLEEDRPVLSQYWFTSRKGEFVTAGYLVDDEVMASVTEAVTTIVHGIEAGLFPARPGPPSTSPFIDCRYCDPDELGTSEARRRWERKSQDEALADYLELVEPMAEPDDPSVDGPEAAPVPAEEATR